MQFESKVGDKTFNIEIREDRTAATINGEKVDIEWIVQKQGRILLRVDTHLFRIGDTGIDDQEITFTVNGRWREATVKNEKDLLLEQLGFTRADASSESRIDAPMPGKILRILVEVGQEVEQGEPVVILEAMKMENELKAPSAGTIQAILASTGDSVEKRQPLLEIKARG
ncbi:MAG: biotin/lipoyl-containing protein [Balneolaceae bacterium]